MIQCLREIRYWNLFQDVTDPSQVQFSQDPVFGVDTNVRSKGLMVSALQQVVRERQIKIYCAHTLEEMRSFGQEVTEARLHVRFRGEGGSPDDRVMSLVFAVYVAVSYPIYRHNIPKKHSNPEWDAVHRELKQQNAPVRERVFYD
jgi:hypothetical protein